jgi:hypothetical protein
MGRERRLDRGDIHAAVLGHVRLEHALPDARVDPGRGRDGAERGDEQSTGGPGGTAETGRRLRPGPVDVPDGVVERTREDAREAVDLAA